MKNKKCENCSHYIHSPDILGGIAKCMLDVKPLLTFWPNDACDKFNLSNDDKLKPQNNFYKQNNVPLKIKNN